MVPIFGPVRIEGTLRRKSAEGTFFPRRRAIIYSLIFLTAASFPGGFGPKLRRLPPMMRAFLRRLRPIDAERGGRRWLDDACWMSCPNKSNWMLGLACRADSRCNHRGWKCRRFIQTRPKCFIFHSLCPYRQVEQSGDDEITPQPPSGAGAAVPGSALPVKGSFFLTSAVVLLRKEIGKRVEKCSQKDDHGQFHRTVASITGWGPRRSQLAT